MLSNFSSGRHDPFDFMLKNSMMSSAGLRNKAYRNLSKETMTTSPSTEALGEDLMNGEDLKEEKPWEIR